LRGEAGEISVPRRSFQRGDKWPPFTSRFTIIYYRGKAPNEYILNFLLIELDFTPCRCVREKDLPTKEFSAVSGLTLVFQTWYGWPQIRHFSATFGVWIFENIYFIFNRY